MKEKFITACENQDIEIYPNPKDGKIYLNTQHKKGELKLIIKDIAGETVHCEIIEYETKTIDLNNLSHGIYEILVLEDNETKLVKRIAKMNGHPN